MKLPGFSLWGGDPGGTREICMNSHTPNHEIPPEVVLENAPCPCGCPEGDEPVLDGDDRLHGLPGRFTIVKCRTCGLKRTDPRPNQATMGFYYPADYDPYTKSRAATGPVRRSGWKARAKRIFETRSNAIPDLAPGTMLEIGCASGNYMQAMADQGWQVQGLEPSATAAEFSKSRGFEVTVSDLESASYPDESFDLIVGWMVMEHLHSPVECLRKMHRWLKPGGALVFSVPNAGSYEFDLFGDAWFALQLPTHLFHYDPRSLDKVLASADWRLERIIFQRNNGNLPPSIGYVLREAGMVRFGNHLISGNLNGKLIFRLLTFPYAWLVARLGVAGRMTVWARKS